MYQIMSRKKSKMKNDKSDDESSNEIRCGIAGCFDDYVEYTECCNEPVCEKHSKNIECGVNKCDIVYCLPCARINGYICNVCDKFFCDEHNTNKYTCKCSVRKKLVRQ